MQQDSIHHSTAPQGSESYSFDDPTEQEALTVHANHHRPLTARADTARPDPRLMKPFAPDSVVRTQAPIISPDYWAHGLLRVEKSEFLQTLDSITGNESTVASLQVNGKAGDPVPYRFRTDNFVTIVLMASFFLVVWVIAHSRRFLTHSVKNFFHERMRENLFAERTDNELRGQLFLIFQTCFVLGILFFDCTQELQVDVFNQVSPYKILGVSTGICCLYYLLKIGVCSFVNRIFFTRDKCERWQEAYLLTVLALGTSLFPVALLVVYFDLSLHALVVLTFTLLAIDKLLLLYKTYRIFFSYTLGWVHLILYFCTLEVTPLLILWRALTYANNYLLTIN